MTVRRLTQWTRALFSRVAARMRFTRPPARDRQPILVGSASALSSVSSDSWGNVAPTHWLEDARRMRPRRVRALPLSPTPHDEAAGERSHRPHADSEACRSPSSVNSLPLATDGASRVKSREAQSLRPETSQEILPAESEPAAEATDMDETLRRRLRSLQFLVRHGVYNEGFARNTLPEQYRRSAGMGDAEDTPL